MTEKEIQKLIWAIEAISDSVDAITSQTGQMGWTIADSLETNALEMSRANDRKEKELVSKDPR